MSAFSNHNTPRTSSSDLFLDDDNTNHLGETLWCQIMVHLEIPERDEIKRILGTDIIEKNEGLHSELVALKSILDDYRQQLHNEQVGRGCIQNTFEVEEKLRKRTRSNKNNYNRSNSSSSQQNQKKSNNNDDDDDDMERTTNKMMAMTTKNNSESLLRRPSSVGLQQKKFLENQIRMFVSNLSNLNSNTAEALKTPRERMLVKSIVGETRNRSNNSNHNRSSAGNQRTSEFSLSIRKSKNVSSTTTTSTSSSSSSSFSPTMVKSPPRPGTAPEEHHSNSTTILRPSSRESSISISSAPDVLIGLTPYLNIHQVDSVLQTIQLSLREENKRLMDDIHSVNSALERLYNSKTAITKRNKKSNEREEEEEEEEELVVANEKEESTMHHLLPPSLDELRDLSDRLEQRCRLVDIFQNKKINRTMVPPLPINKKMGGGVSSKKGGKGEINGKTYIPSSTVSSGGGSSDGRNTSVNSLNGSNRITPRKKKKKSSLLRSRIKEAQDSQYLT
jgi:hypothetical protein